MSTQSHASQNLAANSVDLLPINSNPFGRSYEEYIINYYKFTYKYPLEGNPAEDPTGEHCTLGQNVSSYPIFYLHANAGGNSVKSCNMPSGMGLFIPILQAFSSTAEEPKATVEGLRDTVTEDISCTDGLSLIINDKKFSYEELQEFRVITKDFLIDLPERNMVTIDPGIETFVTDGFQVITSPLEPGNYVVKFNGTTTELGTEPGKCTIFSSTNTYNLIVQ